MRENGIRGAVGATGGGPFMVSMVIRAGILSSSSVIFQMQKIIKTILFNSILSRINFNSINYCRFYVVIKNAY